MNDTMKGLVLLAGLAAVAGCSSSGEKSNPDAAPATGGMSGGAGSGGALGAGGHGLGGGSGAGGRAGTGGQPAGVGGGGVGTGGDSGAGGGRGTGGLSGSGGAAGTGGAGGGTGGRGSGGAAASGGAPGVGGALAGTGGRGTGGTVGTGGVAGTGGASGSGGQRVDGGACSGGFSDDFSGAALDPCWTILNGNDPANPLIDVSVNGGALHLQARPTPDGVWFGGSTRSLVYKLVTTNHFKVTATVHPRQRTDVTAIPTHQLHVGGLMARNPSSQGGATENYLFVMAGHTEGNDGVAHQGIEVKTTTNGSSVWDEPDWPSNDADLRICRLGSDFYLYKRVPGTTTWMLSNQSRQAAPVSRPDMPDTLQVGMALNFSANSDLQVAFDYITMSATPPATVDDCTTD